MATSYRLLPLPGLWAEKISTVLDPGKVAELLDLCSGSGGPMPLILEELEALGCQAHATLTDLYPKPESSPHPKLSWIAEPVDATQVSPSLEGVRTMFSAFHHFRPDAAKAILRDAFERRCTICIFESGSRTLLTAGTMIGVPVAVLALMPFARPFRWAYLVFTYLIPLLPLIVLWDGMISLLRVYSPEQMKELTEDLQAPDYMWEIGLIRLRGTPRGLPYLIGRPDELLAAPGQRL